MRTILLAGTAAAALTVIGTGSAKAQIPVTDVANATLNMQQILNQVSELAQWAKQLEEEARQYQQMVAQTEALVHTTNLAGLAAELGIGGTWLPDAQAITALMQGQGSWGQAAQLAARMRAYGSPMTDEVTAEMQRRESVTANAGALATASDTDIQQHLIDLAALQERLSAAKDVTEVSAVNGLIALAQQRLDAHRASLENVALMLEADNRVTQQREEQLQRRSADALFAATAPAQEIR